MCFGASASCQLRWFTTEVVEWANELDTKMADFAANAEFLTGLAADAPTSERRVLRQRVKDGAAATAGALRALSEYIG